MLEQAGSAGSQTPCTYVYLGDCYINNATHNNQGVKCIPCITEIVLHGAEKPGKREGDKPTEEKKKKHREEKNEKKKQKRHERKERREKNERRKRLRGVLDTLTTLHAGGSNLGNLVFAGWRGLTKARLVPRLGG